MLPLLLVAGVYFGFSKGRGGGDTRPLVMIAAFFLFSNVLGFGIRKFGTSGRIAVDQMQGTVTFTPIGGKRTSLHISELERITLTPVNKTQGTGSPSVNRSGTWMVLGLETSAGENYRLIMQNEASILRMLADELSVLTSVSVSENTCDI
jgi:hypothetical protein